MAADTSASTIRAFPCLSRVCGGTEFDLAVSSFFFPSLDRFMLFKIFYIF